MHWVKSKYAYYYKIEKTDPDYADEDSPYTNIVAYIGKRVIPSRKLRKNPRYEFQVNIAGIKGSLRIKQLNTAKSIVERLFQPPYLF